MQQPRILLAGGGTGGHIFPLIPVIRELKERGAAVAFIGPEEFPLDVLRAEEIDVHTIIRAGKLRRYTSFDNVIDAVKLPFALLQSLGVINKFKPDVVLGKGGYGTIAPVVAAHLKKVPVVLHESDVIPGLANRILQRFATHILIAFNETTAHFPNKECTTVGNPVRTDHLKMKKSEARKTLSLDTDRKVIFVMGGSQGARSINELFQEMLPLLLKKYAIVASVGKGNVPAFKKFNVNNAVVKPHLNEKELASSLVLADVVVSRSGSSALFEMAAYGKPGILIPLQTSTGGHQEANARAYEKHEAVIVLTEDKITPQTLMYAIESVLGNYEVSTHMARQARKFATLDAPQKIADILIQTAQNK